MSPTANEIFWSCPSCMGALGIEEARLRCRECHADYPVTGGVADFRSVEAGFAGDEREADRALEIVTGQSAGDPDALVREFFVAREGPGSGGKRDTERRVRGTLAGFTKLERETRSWLDPLRSGGGPLLDVGCGLGAVVSAMERGGVRCAGVDNRLDILIVARAIVNALVGREVAVLAAADAARLPVGGGTLGGLVYYDVIEHLPALEASIREADRVARKGGWIAISTPNRFSLSAEPHIGVWGIGMVPRGWQVAYAGMRSGIVYSGTVLRSAREVERLVSANSGFGLEFQVPKLAEEDVRSFGVRRRLMARVYNGVADMGAARRVMLLVGPFFRAVGRKGVVGGVG